MKKINLSIVALFVSVFAFAQDEIKEDVVCIYFKSKSSVAGQLCDAYKKLKEFYDYKEYAEDFAKDYKNGKEPRKPPTKLVGGGTIIEKLTNTEKEIKEITVPIKIEPDFSYPTIVMLSSNDPNLRRKSISTAVSYVIESHDILTEYKVLKTDLDLFLKEALAVTKALNILKKKLWEVFQNTGGGYTSLSNIFGFAALDIETKLSPKVSHIRNALNRKIKELNKLIDKEQASINNLQSNTKLIVEAEYQILEKRRIELDSIEQNLKDENSEFQIRSSENEKKGEELAKLEDKLIAQQKELKKNQSDLEKQIENYNSDVRRLNEKEKRINKMKYTGCPNGKSFSNCNHNNQKNSYTTKRNAAVKDYNETSRRTENKAKRINTRQREFKNKADLWSKSYSSFENKAKKWQLENTDLIELQNEIVEHTRELFTYKWDNSSKTEENRLDLEKIETLKTINPN